MSEFTERKTRWRLVLGEGTDQAFGGLGGQAEAMDQALSFLYNREYGKGRNVAAGGRMGGDGDSILSVPDWINQINELFPKKTVERIEKDAMERYGLQEMVTNPEVLARAKPNQTLLKAVLQTKHLMNQEVLAMAKQLVRKVIEELIEKLARDIHTPFFGTRVRKRSFLKIAKNFDAEETIRRNLKNYDPETKRLYIQTPYFLSRKRRRMDRWQIIIVVDQSGSMMDSVIYSAISASIFFGMDSLKAHLLVFDVNVVDLTDECVDPVETLMKVQLGGGTDIANAVSYAETLVENPRRTIMVLITDFYEGGSEHHLLSVTKSLVDSGVTFLGLAALDERAEPCYDKELAGRMARLGAKIGAMTPAELAQFVAEIIS